ncbi:MAG: hypothetical protein ABIG55_03830 [Candidatus Omnitrophota bacterium]|nr:hypothetical protein [Candidatus Omnitrophota bacterium]
MGKKQYKHSVTINDKRRDRKRNNDRMSKESCDQSLQVVFNTLYKDQVRALYRAISKGN